MEPLGIYVHVPFCVRKCLYCDFVSYSISRESHDILNEYVSAVESEIRRKALEIGDTAVKSIFFGGGTPSLVPPPLLARLMEALARGFSIMSNAEITLEANPGTITREVLSELPHIGINRLSLGVQSFDNDLLRRLGRIHSASEALQTFREARNAGMQNINIDLMYGIPGQSLAQWLDSLEQVNKLQPEHIAAYSLIVEKGTAFGNWCSRGILDIPDDDDTADMMEITQAFLENAGWQRYEISNYAKPGFASVHNRIYWNNREYLGFGVGAHSYFNCERSVNTYSVPDYIRKIGTGVSPIVSTERLDLQGQMSETIMLGLRLREGIDLEEFRRRFGIDLLKEFSSQVSKMQDLRLMEVINTGTCSSPRLRLRLTSRGFAISNSVIVEFLK